MSSNSTRVCTIVGAGPGIGLAVARSFGHEGFRLALIARRTDRLELLSGSLKKDGIETLLIAGDAGNESALRKAIEDIHRRLGPTEVLVYNAAAFRQAAPSRLTLAGLNDDFQVNVGGALVATQAVLPAMRAARRGTILLTGGGLALSPAAAVASLSLGKAAIRSLAFSLFQELQPEGIHAATVTICGMVDEGTHFSADKIAAEFLKLHHQEPGAWIPETIYR